MSARAWSVILLSLLGTPRLYTGDMSSPPSNTSPSLQSLSRNLVAPVVLPPVGIARSRAAAVLDRHLVPSRVIRATSLVKGRQGQAACEVGVRTRAVKPGEDQPRQRRIGEQVESVPEKAAETKRVSHFVPHDFLDAPSSAMEFRSASSNSIAPIQGSCDPTRNMQDPALARVPPEPSISRTDTTKSKSSTLSTRRSEVRSQHPVGVSAEKPACPEVPYPRGPPSISRPRPGTRRRGTRSSA